MPWDTKETPERHISLLPHFLREYSYLRDFVVQLEKNHFVAAALRCDFVGPRLIWTTNHLSPLMQALLLLEAVFTCLRWHNSVYTETLADIFIGSKQREPYK